MQLPKIEPGVRLLTFRPERTIREQLLPTDKLVVVVYDGDVTVYASPPAPKDALRHLLSELPPAALAVVLVTQSTPSLTDDGTWIETHLKATVQQVLRPLAADEGPLHVSDDVDVRVSGGEVVVDGVTVRTDVSPTFGVNRRYLLALGKRDATGRRGNSLGFALSIGEGERLTAFDASHSPLNGLSLADVRDAIRDQR